VKVGQILKDLGFQLKSNKKLGRGKDPLDSNARYELINDEVIKSLRDNQPVLYLSVSRAKAQKSENFVKSDLSCGAFLSDLIISWLEGAGKEAFPELKSSLVIVNDVSAASSLLEEFKASLEEGFKESSLSLKVLSVPAGTHRWNLKKAELFSVAAKVSDSLGQIFPESKVFLIAWELPALKESSSSYFVEF
jgi:hypothetical protein